jgi:hypothetical protein
MLETDYDAVVELMLNTKSEIVGILPELYPFHTFGAPGCAPGT